MTYDAICTRCGPVEIKKRMTDPWPTKHDCGELLRRKYGTISVHYLAPGFHSTDVDRLRKQVGSERYAEFEAQKASAERRAKAGKMTEYERALETI